MEKYFIRGIIYTSNTKNFNLLQKIRKMIGYAHIVWCGEQFGTFTYYRVQMHPLNFKM